MIVWKVVCEQDKKDLRDKFRTSLINNSHFLVALFTTLSRAKDEVERIMGVSGKWEMDNFGVWIYRYEGLDYWYYVEQTEVRE